MASRVIDGNNDFANPAIARLVEILSSECRESTVVVFEPEGLAHQAVDTPRVGRSVFGTLAQVRSQHPVVSSEVLGWGIEQPEPVQEGGFSTLMHFELTPGLVHLHDACLQSGSQLRAAWSAYTAAAACTRTHSETPKSKFILMLVPGFVAVAICANGRRSFRGWTGPMADRDWKAFSALVVDPESRPGPSMGEAELRRGKIAVIAEGETERNCPIWPEIRATGRLETVIGLDALALGASRTPTRHSGNLVEGFPRPRQLDRLLVGTVAGCLSAAAALAAGLPGHLRELRTLEASSAGRIASLQVHLSDLSRNQQEMKTLRIETALGSGSIHVGRHEALMGLAAAVPDSLTVTSLSIDDGDHFVIEAIVVGADFDAEGTKRALAQSGFKPASPDGWEYNASAGGFW